ncbi:NINE protein [Campylobacter concisus]|jgi:hypothetical protein|uniref:TM2 domain-containing protein n=1 Tax=Campylobacter concisus TaxID=199 RepID=A0A2R4P088_9BACT|nr:NINE protein [Campylobacter concisus]AVX44102.1 hypothetical protein CCS77_1041 [Campylobacter concisus]
MNANSIVLMLQDKLPKNFALLKMLEDKLASLDEKKLNELAQKLPSLNLKSPAIVFWVGSLIFGAFGVNRFMTGQIWLGVLKLALFLAHIIFIIIIAGAAIDAIGTATTNQDVQNAVVIIGANSFIISILGLVISIWWFVDLFITGKVVRSQNLEKILKAIDEQA